MRLGIGLTTHNRPEVLAKALEHQLKFLPEGAVLVVVDDASHPPAKAPGATLFRFHHNAGISAAKNKCIEMLMDAGCTHFFLFDDDSWPITDDWHLPYINSGIKHLSFTFPRLANGRQNGRRLLSTSRGLAEYGSPCGCMLYFTREVVEVVGGFDVDYPQWGMEHVDFSNRAFNAGLTPKKFLDLADSQKLLHSMDQAQETKGSVPASVKQWTIPANRLRFSQRRASKEFMPYSSPTEGVVLASYFNSLPDPQRGTTWEPIPQVLSPLISSCQTHRTKLVIFHDCLEPKEVDGVEFVKVPRQTEQAPNVWRWFCYREWLTGKDIPYVWMVDSTDVEVLRNPFQAIHPNRLYCGDEYNMTVDNYWMRKNQEPHLASLPDYRATIQRHGRNILLNCGIVGGSLSIVLEYLGHRVDLHEKHTKGCIFSTDMAIFNYILAHHFKGRTTHGLKVNTGFKRNERNAISLFKHK